MKYQKPIPIKAQDGAQISKQDNTRVVIPQVYAPIKAPEGYQKVYRVTNMPTDNKAMTPATIALRGAATGSTKGGLIGAGLGAAGALIGHYYKDDINRAVDNSLNLAKLGLLPAYNFLFGTKPMLQTSESTDTDQSAEQSQTQTETNTSTGTPPNNESNNEDNNDEEGNKNKTFRDKMADKVSDFIRGKKKPTTQKQPKTSNDSFDNAKDFAKKFLWETNANNFGSAWKWRNLGRVVSAPVTVPYASGLLLEGAPNVIEAFGEAFERGRQAGKKKVSNDTVTVQTNKNTPDTIQRVQQVVQPATTSSQHELDSLNNIWLNYIE